MAERIYSPRTPPYDDGVSSTMADGWVKQYYDGVSADPYEVIQIQEDEVKMPVVQQQHMTSTPSTTTTTTTTVDSYEEKVVDLSKQLAATLHQQQANIRVKLEQERQRVEKKCEDIDGLHAMLMVLPSSKWWPQPAPLPPLLPHTSYLLPPTSYLLPPTSYLLPHTSYLLHPTLYLLHLASYLLPPTSYLLTPHPKHRPKKSSKQTVQNVVQKVVRKRRPKKSSTKVIQKFVQKTAVEVLHKCGGW